MTFYSNNRDAYRDTFRDAWQKHLNREVLQPLEGQIVNVIAVHPEYQEVLTQATAIEFAPQDNPFLHMSLHLSVREQLQLDRPSGIKAIYEDLVVKYKDTHIIEHLMMDCLAAMVSKAIQSQMQPDESEYLKMLTKLK